MGNFHGALEKREGLAQRIFPHLQYYITRKISIGDYKCPLRKGLV